MTRVLVVQHNLDISLGLVINKTIFVEFLGIEIRINVIHLLGRVGQMNDIAFLRSIVEIRIVFIQKRIVRFVNILDIPEILRNEPRSLVTFLDMYITVLIIDIHKNRRRSHDNAKILVRFSSKRNIIRIGCLGCQ